MEERRCPLVKEESDLSSDDEDGTERRIANLIDFFFTIVKSQKEDRKNSSGGSCFKTDPSPEEKLLSAKIDTDLEHKMETLIEFLATTGCVENEEKDEKKITLMEFLFGSDDRKWDKPIIEIHTKGMSLSESNVNVKNLLYIDQTPDEERTDTLVEMLLKYMDGYSSKEKLTPKSLSVTPSLSEKSKSDMTLSKLETFSDVSKTRSDSTLTHTQDTVIERELRSDKSSRRISETMVDLSHVKTDLESIFEEAMIRVCEIRMIFCDDIMSEQEDVANFNAYTKPPQLVYTQYLPYSIELSDIIEEDETSSRGVERIISQEERMSQAKHYAEELLRYIEHKIQVYQDDDGSSSGPSTEEYSREFDLSPSQKSISLVDLRNIPDLPPSAILKPKVLKVDKSTSTTEISDSMSDLSKRIDSSCMTDDTTLSSNSERNERALDKLESLHRFFSRSRLEIIDESLEENGEKAKTPAVEGQDLSKYDGNEFKHGQASLDDVEDLIDDNDREEKDANTTQFEQTDVPDD